MDPAIGGIMMAAVALTWQIIRRQLDIHNTTTSDLKKVAEKLVQDCAMWATILKKTFDEVEAVFKANGAGTAEHDLRQLKDQMHSKIKELMGSTGEIDYYALVAGSEVMRALERREELIEFARSCQRFYYHALQLKNISHDQISHFSSQGEVEEAVQFWKNQVDLLLEQVRAENGKVQVLPLT